MKNLKVRRERAREREGGGGERLRGGVRRMSGRIPSKMSQGAAASSIRGRFGTSWSRAIGAFTKRFHVISMWHLGSKDTTHITL